MIAVIDANIAAALFVDLAYSRKARESLARASVLIAPDLVLPEITNTLWKLVHGGQIEKSFAILALDGLTKVLSEVVPTRGLVQDALNLSIDLSHPAYDCFYIALAMQRRAVLFTADARLLRALEASNLDVKYEAIAA
jgi:predicted nucleic acid-binding protein